MSKKTIILILTAWVVTVIILLILIFSNRNSTSGESQFSLEITCDQFLAEKHIIQNIRMQSGDSLGVSLCSNGTTGFQWKQPSNISDTSVLEQTLHKFLPPENQLRLLLSTDCWNSKISVMQSHFAPLCSVSPKPTV